MQDTIERSIAIAAPLERVWDLVPGLAGGCPATPRDSDRTPGHVVVRESEKWVDSRRGRRAAADDVRRSGGRDVPRR